MASHSNPTEMETQILSRLSSPNYDLVKEKKRPVEPFKRFLSWFLMWAIPGAGMFMESYFIFAIGNIKPLLQIDYPNCMGSERPANCNTSVVDNLETIEIAGIIGGMKNEIVLTEIGYNTRLSVSHLRMLCCDNQAVLATCFRMQ